MVSHWHPSWQCCGTSAAYVYPLLLQLHADMESVFEADDCDYTLENMAYGSTPFTSWQQVIGVACIHLVPHLECVEQIILNRQLKLAVCTVEKYEADWPGSFS